MYQKGKINVKLQQSFTAKDPGFGDLLTFLFSFLNSRVLKSSDFPIFLIVDPDVKVEWELTQH